MTPEQIAAAKKRLQDWIARAAGQHARAVRRGFEMARGRLA